MSNSPNPQGLPSQSELLLPLLSVLESAGGELSPGEAMDRLAERLNIPPEMRAAAVESGRGRWEGRKRFVWKNRVAWTRMNAVERDFIDPTTRGKWKVTKKARSLLINARPGIVLKIYETPNGTALWATAEAAAGVIGDNSVNLVFTSPPFALNRPKAYGNLLGHDYINWLVNLGREWRRMLVNDGSIVLNFGATWTPGQPCQSEISERVLLAFIDELKFSLCQRLCWFNPCKFPTTPFVTQQRIRLNPVDEAIYWLGKSPRPFANTRDLLRPYSAGHRRRLERGKVSSQGRPSADWNGAQSRGTNCFVDRGGAIPHSVITAANSNSADSYLKGCREIGAFPHAARLPAAVAETVIRLTTREADVVYDPCSGSNVVGKKAEELGRRWIASDISLAYAATSCLRFPTRSVFLQDGAQHAFEAAL